MGDFLRFRVSGFGVIFCHSVIPPFGILGSPIANTFKSEEAVCCNKTVTKNVLKTSLL